ncbi:VanZ family protein [Verrucomicrobiota bacterium sgz303538]
MNRLLLWLCVALWCGVIIWAGTIFYLSTLTGPQVEQLAPFKFWDKAAHFVAFAAGGALLSGALGLSRRWPLWRTILAATFVLSLYGALDEWHQLYTPLRSGADKWDWFADTVGALSGATVFSILYARRYSRKIAPAPAGD